MKINTKSSMPLHAQVKEILVKEILSGCYSEKIPSEMELMKRFDVSRSTIRQAINGLVDEGYLEKIHGKGTFLALRPVEEWLGQFRTYREIIENIGMRPSIKLVSKGKTSSPKDVAEVLGQKEFYAIKRIKYANEIPIAIEKVYYPIKIGLELAKYNLNNAATYSLLTSMGINLWEAEQIITSAIPTKEQCQVLGIDTSISVLSIERINYDQEENIVEYEKTVFRSDMYSFRVKLGRTLS
ncbi:MAG: GntR family transcriptional regulator [Desulfitibacter sp. BRH_c19]|nr:MAG: GntR family transcriptional regulator [Desulfitibacter sp. BRH_c19]